MPRSGNGGARAPIDVWIFFALPIIYFLVYGFRGFGDTDHGFVSALAWRILEGESIYLDFIYVRPPLSPYLHALVLWALPDSLGLLGERLLFYLSVSGGAFLTLGALSRTFDLDRLGTSPYLCGALGFVFSVNNFSPYAWHTMDGVLFGCLGIFLLLRGGSWPWIAAGIATLVLAALAKQSFYPLPFVGVALLTVLHGRRAGAVTLGFLALTGLGTAAVLWHANPAWLEAFVIQTSSATDLQELAKAGLLQYVEALAVLLPTLLLSWWASRHLPASWRPWVGGGLLWAMVMVLLLLNVVEAFEMRRWQKAIYCYSQGPFLLAVTAAVLEFRDDRKRGATLLALLAVSWCSGISWGTKYPLACFTPVVFGFVLLLRERLRFLPPVAFHRGVLATLLVMFFGLAQFPYGDAPRAECVHPLGELFPRFTGIHTGPWNHRQHAELEELLEIYGEPFCVLPALPLANYITGTRPPLPVDWALNAEVNHRRWEGRILRQLEETAPTIFLQRDHLPILEKEGHEYGSWLGKYIRENWTLVEEREKLLVYKQSHAGGSPR